MTTNDTNDSAAEMITTHEPHTEHHFHASETVRDIIIGMADGLTVPFALAAGLTGAVAATHIIVTAGFAEVAAGSIAMGLGGYLAARSDAEHYDNERQREFDEIIHKRDFEEEEVRAVFRGYGLSEEQIAPILAAFANDHEQWVDFMMRFELGLEKPQPKRALKSALTIAGSYIAGGVVPLVPYIFMSTVKSALIVSVIVTLVTVFAFGYIKGRLTGRTPIRSAIQTGAVSAVAAAAAFLIARAIGNA